MSGGASVARPATIVLRPPSLRARLLGLGSIFGKSFRDSRRSAVLLGGLFLIVFVATASQVAEQFATVEERAKMAAELAALPAVFQGLLGEPIGIERLGGFMSWRLLNFMPVTLGIWSIVAMSGLLGAEVSRGSMDLVASAPISRARIALQKLLGYLAALAIAILLLVVGMVISFQAFATLPGDAVGVDAILAHAAWVYLAVLVPGAVAFALAPLAGRGPALGIAATVLFGSFIVHGFASSVSAFETLKPVSYFAITAAHRPLAGSYDWPSIGVISAASAILLAAGVLAFARRDLLVPTGGRLRLPTVPLFLGGPFTRAVGERLPSAIVWGLGLGVFGLFIASSADQFVATIGQIPQVVDQLRARDYADVERVGHRHHRDVEPGAVEDRAERIQRLDLGTAAVQRRRRAGHVRDHHVVDGRARQRRAGHHTQQPAVHAAGEQLRQVHQKRRPQRPAVLLGALV